MLLSVLPAGSSILLGLSGGVDSVVLLHLLHRLASIHSWRLRALHVHHGISPHAGEWAAFCTGLCARYGIPLQVEHVDITPLRDEHGIEAAARKLRHAAFGRQQADFIALAHHQDDQAETLLLQLLRGAGVRGASAMPFIKRATAHTPSPLAGEGWGEGGANIDLSPSLQPSSVQGEGIRSSPALLRPLLDVARSELLGYARQHDLQWVEDESNADDAYPRNFLRHRVLPLLEQRFPAYRETLARSARHFAEANELLDQLARQDAPDLCPSPFGGEARGEGGEFCLTVSRLQSISQPRAKNLLRYFLHMAGAPMPQAVQLDEMLRQLCEAHEDGKMCAEFGGWQLRRYRGRAYAMPAPGRLPSGHRIAWNGETELEWPALDSTLVFSRATGEGVSLERLTSAQVTLRLRGGGETLRPNHAAATRSLKKLLQQHHVPPWRRERLPLLYCGETLVSVVGVAIAADYQAQQGGAGMVVRLKQQNL